MATTIPPLPPGFVLETPPADVSLPPLPPGFELVEDDGPGLEIDIVGGTREIDVGQAAAPAPASARTADGWEPGLLRDLMMGARSVIQSGGSLIGALGGDAFNHYLLPGDQPSYRDAAAGLADRLGLPKPETGRERVMGDIGEALAGTGLTMGLGGALNAGRTALTAPSMRTAAADLLTAQPKLQAVSAATGAGAASGTREAGGGELAQVFAGLAGGLAPAAVTAGTPMAIRGALRGGEGNRASLERAIADFDAVGGATPTVGQGTGSRLRQGLENLLGAGPTSAGVMARAGERQGEQIGAGLNSLARSMSRNPTAEGAGRAINEGIRGDGGFIQTTRARAGQLYDDLRRHIPEDTRVEVTNVRQALADLNSEIPGAPSLSRFFQNARLEGIEGALAADTAGVGGVLSRPGMAEAAEGYRKYLQAQADAAAARNADRSRLGMNNFEPVPTAADIDANVQATLRNMVDERLPYEALQKLRTLVGNELEGSTLLSDVPRSKWKAVYAALTRDMEAAATTPEAKQALSRANAYFNARIKRIDLIDSVIEKNGGPERVFQAAMQGTREGATVLRAVMRSLPEDAQKDVSAAVIRRLGMVNPGQAGADAGEQFSAATFLTNWNKLSPEARAALFDRFGPQVSRDIDRIARVADRIKEGSGVLRNPSGTAGQVAAFSYGGGLTMAILTGNLPAAAKLAAGGGLANVIARAMTSPQTVNWLARNTEKPVGALPAQISVLKRIAAENNDEAAADLAAALEGSEEER